MDSIENNLLNKTSTSQQIEDLNKQAFAFSNTDPAKSKELAEKAFVLSNKNKLPRGQAKSLHLIGLYHLRSGDLKAAIEKSRASLELFTELNDENGMSSTLNTLGIAYRNTGSFDRGLDCLIKSLKIETGKKNDKNLVKLYGNIGNILDNMGKHSEGLQYYKKCLRIAGKLKDNSATADAYSNLGACYHHLEEFTKSINAHRKALKIRESLKNKRGISFCLNNLGLIYESQGKYKKALEYYLKSLDIKTKLKMKLETARTCNTVGNLYSILKDHETATKYLRKGAVLANKVNSPVALRDNHIYQASHNKELKNFEKALYHHIEYHKLDRQILNSTRIASMEAQLGLMNSELYAANEKLELANSKLSTLSVTDGLTGLFNRRRFDEFLHQEWNRCKRIEAPLSLLMFDLDFFKLFNDTYGHLEGDDCLKKTAKSIQNAAMRTTDLAARYGGEEFAIILSDTNSQGAKVVARAARAAVAALAIPHTNSAISDVVTVSVGIASMIPKKENNSAELIEKADKALYFSKETGRNRITLYEIQDTN